MQNNLHTNTLLPEEEKKISSYAYYGDFLWSLSFDDGWSTSIYPKLLKFIETSQARYAGKIIIEKKQTQDAVPVILAVETMDKPIATHTSELTTSLQKDFHMQSVRQYVWYTSWLFTPLMLEEPEEASIWYSRWHVQNMMCEILSLKERVHTLSYAINILKDSQEYYDQYAHNKRALERYLWSLEDALPELIAQQYFHITTKKHLDDTNIYEGITAHKKIWSGFYANKIPGYERDIQKIPKKERSPKPSINVGISMHPKIDIIETPISKRSPTKEPRHSPWYTDILPWPQEDLSLKLEKLWERIKKARWW